MSGKTKIAMLIVLPGAVALLGTCAKERDPVDRVQPHAVDKMYFIGEDFEDTTDDPEFYTRNHVIDVGYGASGAGTRSLYTSSSASPVGRIKWQITEDYLIGRLSYERIEDSDGKGDPKLDQYGTAVGAATNDGVIVAMFAIESHFDITHAYNPTTGEKLNVIEENDRDRPWYERQYMRVDWSKNLNTDSYDFDTLTLMGLIGGIEYEPVSFFVEDPNDEQAPHFDLENGYFDVTTKAFAKPREVDISHLGWSIDKVPACFFSNDFFGGSEPVGNCNPVEITLRHSFVRVDKDGDGVEDSDYEPRSYDGYRFRQYGGFYSHRFGYARNYGMTDDKWHRMLNRYNLWERSHYYDDPETMTGWVPCNTEETTPAGSDPNRDVDRNGTADECEEVTALADFSGSRCDPFKHRCTLPYRARTPKPIPFYYTDTSHPDFFEPSELAVHEWDVALRQAVQTARYAECVRTVKTPTKLPRSWDAWARDVLEDAEAWVENPNPDEADVQQGILEEAIVPLKDAYKASREAGDRACKQAYPMWTGQMDDQRDAVQLALEIDDCRQGKAHPDMNRQNCESLADTIGDDRDVAGWGHGVREIALMEEMLVLCHSPVRHDDPELCGENRLPIHASDEDCVAARNIILKEIDDDLPGELQSIVDGNEDIDNLEDLVEACDQAIRVRNGDLRYHVLNVIKEPQSPSPWGIMSSSVDPLTGETIATNCNIWSHVTDLATQKVVDQMRLLKGELSFEDVTEAKNVSEWVRAANAASSGGSLAPLTREQLSSRLSSFLLGKSNANFLDEFEAGTIDGRAVSTGERQEISDLLRDLEVSQTPASAAYGGSAILEARRRAAHGTELEAALMTQAIQQQNGIQELALTQSVMDMASPLRGGNPSLQRDISMMMQNNLHKRNMCIIEADHATASPVALAPLADIIEWKFGKFNRSDSVETQLERAERARQYLAQQIHFGVISHEIGHSISHRHNFVASSDAFSYRPQYWQLRTKDGAVRRQCRGDEPDGEDCIGPRYLDPLTDNERDNLIHMFQTSSVMDYPGDIAQDFMAPGIYDFAATRMFYGDVATVMEDEEAGDVRAGPLQIFRSKSHLAAYKDVTGFGGLFGIAYLADFYIIHYTELQEAMKMIRYCRDVEDTEAYRPGRYDDNKSGRWHPVLDGKLVAPDGETYTRCRQPPVDYVNWSTLTGPQYPDRVVPEGYLNLVDWYREYTFWDDKERVVAPYTMGTDSWADIGNVSVFRHDNGADLFEILNFMITEKELSYIFDKFRRGRSDFSIRSASSRGLVRYDAKIRDAAKALAYYKNIIALDAYRNGNNLEVIWPEKIMFSGDRLRSHVVASSYAFDYFARELSRPEAGEHGFSPGDVDAVLRSARDSGLYYPDSTVIVPNGPTGYWDIVSPGGELLENELADDKGEFDHYYTMNCGSYYDKINVAMLLTESVDNYISSDRTDFHDPRYRSNSLADLFPEGYRRLIGNALTNDEFIKGPRVAADDLGAVVTNRDGTLGHPIGWTRWWGETPVYCYPQEGRSVCGDFLGDEWNSDDTPNAYPIDSQIGWEQQKFLIAWTLLYLPENEKQNWLNQLGLWELGRDADPGFEDRIELHHPNGRTYVARRFGQEEIFGRTVEKGIAARVLQYANQLLTRAYETVPIVGLNEEVIGYEAVRNEEGEPVVLYDESMNPLYRVGVNEYIPALSENCDEDDNSGCVCYDNRACMELEDYVSVPAFLRQALSAYRMRYPDREGIWE